MRTHPIDWELVCPMTVNKYNDSLTRFPGRSPGRTPFSAKGVTTRAGLHKVARTLIAPPGNKHRLAGRGAPYTSTLNSWTFGWMRAASCPGERQWKHRASMAGLQAPLRPRQSFNGWAAGSWKPGEGAWPVVHTEYQENTEPRRRAPFP